MTRARTHTCKDTRAHTHNTQIHMHARMHTHVCACTHVHTHTLIYHTINGLLPSSPLNHYMHAHIFGASHLTTEPSWLSGQFNRHFNVDSICIRWGISNNWERNLRDEKISKRPNRTTIHPLHNYALPDELMMNPLTALWQSWVYWMWMQHVASIKRMF